LQVVENKYFDKIAVGVDIPLKQGLRQSAKEAGLPMLPAAPFTPPVTPE